MAFAMSLPRTKRVRHVDAGGVEVFVDDERFEFLREDGIPLQVSTGTPSMQANCLTDVTQQCTFHARVRT